MKIESYAPVRSIKLASASVKEKGRYYHRSFPGSYMTVTKVSHGNSGVVHFKYDGKETVQEVAVSQFYQWFAPVTRC